MRLHVCLLSCLIALSVAVHTEPQGPARPALRAAPNRPVPPPTGRLAVRRVVLYKNGVGFFEHMGRVTGNQDLTVTFTSAQLDDALKSLTALDLGKGQIAGITYNSLSPLAQRAAATPFRLAEKSDHMEFFRSLRGTRLEVRSAGLVHRGRLLSAEPLQPMHTGTPEALTMLTLVGESGQVRSVRLDRQASVRLLDADVSSSVTHYLSSIADDLRRDERRVTIAARGTGVRDLYVSYIAEVPAWKSTYRLLMPGNGRPAPLLLGWAVVDNTVGEDWEGVEMALVAGAPQSFIQKLSQPNYVTRPVVDAPVDLGMTPMTHGAGMGATTGLVRGVVRDQSGGVLPGVTVTLQGQGVPTLRAVTNEQGAFSVAARPGRYRLSFDLAGFVDVPMTVDVTEGDTEERDVRLRVGALQETITVTGRSPEVDTSSSEVVSAPDVRTIEEQMTLAMPEVSGQPVGELFEYRISDRITVRKNQSALVPILNAAVAAERVSLWNDQVGAARPLRALWLTNTTGSTLDGGTVSIVDGGAFAGEGTIEALVPGARRLISYARDLSMAVSARSAADRRTLVALGTADGMVVERRETCARRTYTLQNDDAAPRTLVIEHPVRSGWRLAGGLSPAESTAAAHRFTVAVPARSTEVLVVREVRPSEFRYDAGQLTAGQVASYSDRDAVGPAGRAALQGVLDRRQALSVAEAARERLTDEGQSIVADQGRVRENMGALKGSSEERQLLQRYVRQLSEHENRLETLARQSDVVTQAVGAARRAFDQAVRALAIELAAPGAACR